MLSQGNWYWKICGAVPYFLEGSREAKKGSPVAEIAGGNQVMLSRLELLVTAHKKYSICPSLPGAASNHLLQISWRSSGSGSKHAWPARHAFCQKEPATDSDSKRTHSIPDGTCLRSSWASSRAIRVKQAGVNLRDQRDRDVVLQIIADPETGHFGLDSGPVEHAQVTDSAEFENSREQHTSRHEDHFLRRQGLGAVGI